MTVTLVVDGGGSATRCAVVTNGNLIREPVIGRSANPMAVGLEAAVQHLLEVIDEAWSAVQIPGSPDRALLACSAAGDRETSSSFGQLLQEHIDVSAIRGSELWLTNDLVPWLLCDPWERSAIVAAAGTGTGFAARGSTGRWARASGREYLLADEGGGFDLGLSGLRAAVRAADGRGAPTRLCDAAHAWAAARGGDLAAVVYQTPFPKAVVASFAGVVLEEAAADDPVALSLVDAAADEVVVGVDAVRRRARVSDVPVIWCIGSLLVGGSSVLRDRVIHRLSAIGEVRLGPADNPLAACAQVASLPDPVSRLRSVQVLPALLVAGESNAPRVRNDG